MLHLPILKNFGSSIFPSFTNQYDVQKAIKINKDAAVVKPIANIPFLVFKDIFLKLNVYLILQPKCQQSEFLMTFL